MTQQQAVDKTDAVVPEQSKNNECNVKKFIYFEILVAKLTRIMCPSGLMIYIYKVSKDG